MDPLSLVMFGLIAVLIFFMFRNGKKRQQAQREMQDNVRPGAEVMLQSGIFATIEEIDEEENRITVRSGDSNFVVHRNAIGQVVTPVDAPAETSSGLAPDDDPAFGERFGDAPKNTEIAPEDTESDAADENGTEGDAPKA